MNEIKLMRGTTLFMVIAAALAFSTGATAAIVTVSYDLPTTAQLNPLANATTGTVVQNITGSITNVRRSPWESEQSSVDYTASDAYYTTVSGGASATYNFSPDQTALSFVWGSPDTYNDLTIVLTSGGLTEEINGSAIIAELGGTAGSTSALVTISDISFDQVVFESGTNAFEFANLQAVPLPAAAWLFGSAILGLAVVARRRA